MSTPCKDHVLVVQRRQAWFLELELSFLNGNLGHQRALTARLFSNGVSAIQVISDGILMSCVAVLSFLTLDKIVHSGQRCFVDVFGFMHLCVLLPNADGGGI